MAGFVSVSFQTRQNADLIWTHSQFAMYQSAFLEEKHNIHRQQCDSTQQLCRHRNGLMRPACFCFFWLAAETSRETRARDGRSNEQLAKRRKMRIPFRKNRRVLFVLEWSTQNHASRTKKADIRSYFCLGLYLTNLHLPGF